MRSLARNVVGPVALLAAALPGLWACGGAVEDSGSGGAPGGKPTLEDRLEAFCTTECAARAAAAECNYQWTDCLDVCDDATTSALDNCKAEMVSYLDCTDEHPGYLQMTCDGDQPVVGESGCEEEDAALGACSSGREPE